MSALPYNVGMIGFGTVGRGVEKLLREQANLYTQRLGRPLNLTHVLVRDPAKALAPAPDQPAAALDPAAVTADPDAFFAGEFDLVIEVAGGLDPVGGYLHRALAAGKHVVTANKSLLAARGPELFADARKYGVSIAFEASCGGGIPCVTALTAGLMANQIHGLYGILNGTCNYILTQMTRHGETYADALAGAKEKGYAEADETLDVSGADAAQKLAILASLAFGVRVTDDDVPRQGINTLDLDDVRFGDELGYDMKLIAAAERWPGQPFLSLHTAPCFIAKSEQLAQVHGSFNALSAVGHAVGHTMYYGRGAGQGPTASAIVADVFQTACGAYPLAFDRMKLTPDLHAPAQLVEPDDVEGRWYLRVNALDVPGVVAQMTKALGDRRISLSSLLQHDAPPDSEVVPVVITTHHARRGDLDAAAEWIARVPEVRSAPVIYRILDLPD
ncbi:MAG: homoserine dehydrogenase [Planctomycetota bacterium]